MKRMLYCIFNSVYVALDKYEEINLLNEPSLKEQFCEVMPFTLLINIQSNSVGSLSMVSLLGKSHWFEQRTTLTFLNENSVMLKIIGKRAISIHKCFLQLTIKLRRNFYFFYVKNEDALF